MWLNGSPQSAVPMMRSWNCQPANLFRYACRWYPLWYGASRIVGSIGKRKPCGHFWRYSPGPAWQQSRTVFIPTGFGQCKWVSRSAWLCQFATKSVLLARAPCTSGSWPNTHLASNFSTSVALMLHYPVRRKGTKAILSRAAVTIFPSSKLSSLVPYPSKAFVMCTLRRRKMFSGLHFCQLWWALPLWLWVSYSACGFQPDGLVWRCNRAGQRFRWIGEHILPGRSLKSLVGRFACSTSIGQRPALAPPFSGAPSSVYSCASWTASMKQHRVVRLPLKRTSIYLRIGISGPPVASRLMQRTSLLASSNIDICNSR